ncbi:hypothetical protein [Streptococcus pluranimalium]|uniref:hypothetical protein n=1 Tax=Streptococcus pluranimalium TaxID=82348 RepID=UPI003F68EB02
MKLEKAPLATAGLVLGLLGLGNVLSNVSLVFTASCGILALVTLVYLIYSMMTDPQSVKNQISNPLVSSVFTTFFMSGFLGTVYLKIFLEKILLLQRLSIHFGCSVSLALSAICLFFRLSISRISR